MSDTTRPRALAPDDADTVLSPPQQPDELGRLGDYRVLRRLGRGGMGAVYLAEDTRLRREVALKVMAPRLAADERSKVRFLREARAAAGIRHPNVVTIYDVNEQGEVAFISMERLRGVTLEAWLTQKGTPPLPHVVRIAAEVASGLAAAHERGLVHRDVKPSNVWLEKPAGTVKLLDFGLAVQPDTDTRVTADGLAVGTPEYMAPEQARGEPVDHRADLFSLGVLLYRMCTGRQPFTGPNSLAVMHAVTAHTPPPVRALNPDIPVGLDHLIQRLMAKFAKDRPASAEEVIRELRGPLTTPTGATVPAQPAVADGSGWGKLVPIPIPAPMPMPMPMPMPLPVNYQPGMMPPAYPAPAASTAVPSAFPTVVPPVQPAAPRPARDQFAFNDDEDDRPIRSRRPRGGSDGMASISKGAAVVCMVSGPVGLAAVFLPPPLYYGAGLVVGLGSLLSMAGLVFAFLAKPGHKKAGAILNVIAMLVSWGFAVVVAVLVVGKMYKEALDNPPMITFHTNQQTPLPFGSGK
jgi:hypothetical protein